MKCPNCKKGRLFPAIPHKTFPIDGLLCDICSGSGKLPDYISYNPTLGDIWKGSRISKGITLQEQSKLLKISPSKLSKMERGYFYNDKMIINWRNK